MKTAEQKAVDIYSDGYNCAQAVLGAFCEDLGLDLPAALKLANGFGGGFRCGEVCGAVAGAVMVIGLKHGFHVKGDFTQKGICYNKTAEFNERFTLENNTLICRDLLGLDVWSKDEVIHQKAVELCKTLCPKFVASAARILETII